MNLESMPLEELNALAEMLDRERLTLLARKRELGKARAWRAHADHAAQHGFSVEEYDAAKAEAVAAGVSMAAYLRIKHGRTNLIGASVRG